MIVFAKKYCAFGLEVVEHAENQGCSTTSCLRAPEDLLRIRYVLTIWHLQCQKKEREE